MNFLLRLEQLHKSENQTLTKTDRRLEQLHQIALSVYVLTMLYIGTGKPFRWQGFQSQGEL